MLKEWIAKGKPYYLFVLKVGDLYFLPKGVGHFFFTLHGTTHSVIGVQTVLKRPPPRRCLHRNARTVRRTL